MKAIICRSYGAPDVLRLDDVPKPVPRENELLIRIRATSVTAGEVSFEPGKFDVVLDTVGKSPFSACVKALTDNGIYLRVVHMHPADILRGIWTSFTTNKKVVAGVISETADDMAFLTGLFEMGELKPVIDRSYSLEQIPEAHTYVEAGHKKGNVVVAIPE